MGWRVLKKNMTYIEAEGSPLSLGIHPSLKTDFDKPGPPFSPVYCKILSAFYPDHPIHPSTSSTGYYLVVSCFHLIIPDPDPDPTSS